MDSRNLHQQTNERPPHSSCSLAHRLIFAEISFEVCGEMNSLVRGNLDTKTLILGFLAEGKFGNRIMRIHGFTALRNGVCRTSHLISAGPALPVGHEDHSSV